MTMTERSAAVAKFISSLRPEMEEFHSQAILGDLITDGTASTSNSNENSSFDNAGFFTSMEAKFEWNCSMVPDYCADMIDPNYSIGKIVIVDEG